MNERGVMFPFLLFILLMVQLLAFTGTGAMLSKSGTAKQLTAYYEMKIMELMALKEIELRTITSFPETGTYKTTHGTIFYTVQQGTQEERLEITLKTVKESSSFSSIFIYNKQNGTFIKQIEESLD